jgi:hypothetical protein
MSNRSNAAEAWYAEAAPAQLQVEHQIDLLPPASLTEFWWQSLYGNLRDTVAPEKLPPLQLTSRPVDLGAPLGDRLQVPWFRTVFTNLGDVISPETLPPLQLESIPVEVGELISDQLGHLWFSSLLRNLADRFVPERLPKLELTAKPVDDIMPANYLLLPAWSEVISTPKVFYPDKPKAASASVALPLPIPAAMAATPALLRKHPTEAALLRDVHRSRIRTFIWMGMAAAEAVYVIVSMVQPR